MWGSTALACLMFVGMTSAWVTHPFCLKGAPTLLPGLLSPWMPEMRQQYAHRRQVSPRMSVDVDDTQSEIGDLRLGALEHIPGRLVKRSPFQTAVSSDKVLQVKAWGRGVMSVPVNSITAFRFWPTNEGALVLLLMSNGQQKIVPLPLSEEVTQILQDRLEFLEYNSPAATAVRRLKGMVDGRQLASEAYSNVALSSAPPKKDFSTSTTSQQQAPSPSAKQHFVFFGMDKHGSLEVRKQNREAHLAFVRDQPAGRVLLGGPFLRPEDGAMVGSMLVLQGTRAQVEAMCNVDPYFTAGLFQNTRIEEWKWAIDAGKTGDAGAGENLCVLECRDKPGSLEVRKANREAHLAYLKQMGDKVVSAGPLLDGDGNMCGSVIIFKGTEDEASHFAQNDPYAAAHLFAKVDIKRWKRVIDNRAPPAQA